MQQGSTGFNLLVHDIVPRQVHMTHIDQNEHLEQAFLGPTISTMCVLSIVLSNLCTVCSIAVGENAC